MCQRPFRPDLHALPADYTFEARRSRRAAGVHARHRHTVPGPVSSERLRILVVDDDAVTRLTLESVIRGAGWSPVAIDDPELAFQILTGADAPPIALIDWQMPTLSGIDLCRRVRAADVTARPYPFS